MALFPSKGSHTLSGPSSKAERTQIRQLIKKAANGNLTAFVQASSLYLDLFSEYLYLLGYTNSVDRLYETQKLLAETWRYIPYTRRVSDFERFIQIQLERRKETSSLDLPAPHENLSKLSHKERFLLVSRAFESWDIKALHLSLRVKKTEVSRDLMLLKSRLIGFRNSMLKQHQQAQVQQLSDLLEGELSSKAARNIEKEIAHNFHVLRFKAEWLAYRCELVELRQEMIFSPEEKSELKERLTVHLKKAPTEQPKLSDNIINQFSFVRLPSNAN